MTIAVRNVTSHARLIECITHPPRALSHQERPVAANDLVRIQTEKQIERDKILSRLNQIGQELKRLEATLRVNPASGNFLKDILSDATGVPLHRFQMLVWTVVLGIVFALQVYRNLAMMDFSPELLALQGISGGTYLGFKVPEAPASSGGPAT